MSFLTKIDHAVEDVKNALWNNLVNPITEAIDGSSCYKARMSVELKDIIEESRERRRQEAAANSAGDDGNPPTNPDNGPSGGVQHQ